MRRIIQEPEIQYIIAIPLIALASQLWGFFPVYAALVFVALYHWLRKDAQWQVFVLCSFVLFCFVLFCFVFFGERERAIPLITLASQLWGFFPVYAALVFVALYHWLRKDAQWQIFLVLFCFCFVC